MSSPSETGRRMEAVEELARAIRELPQASASSGFQAAVLARAAAAGTHRRRQRRRLLSLAAGTCVVVAGLGSWRLGVVRFEAARAERRAELIEEHRRLADELHELRALAERRSSIRLGGDATTDLYIDLAPVAAGEPAASGSERPPDLPRSHS